MVGLEILLKHGEHDSKPHTHPLQTTHKNENLTLQLCVGFFFCYVFAK